MDHDGVNDDASFETQNGPGFLHIFQKRFTKETKMSPRGPEQTIAFEKT